MAVLALPAGLLSGCLDITSTAGVPGSGAPFCLMGEGGKPKGMLDEGSLAGVDWPSPPEPPLPLPGGVPAVASEDCWCACCVAPPPPLRLKLCRGWSILATDGCIKADGIATDLRRTTPDFAVSSGGAASADMVEKRRLGGAIAMSVLTSAHRTGIDISVLARVSVRFIGGLALAGDAMLPAPSDGREWMGGDGSREAGGLSAAGDAP